MNENFKNKHNLTVAEEYKDELDFISLQNESECFKTQTETIFKNLEAFYVFKL